MISSVKVVNLVYDKRGLMGEWTKPLILIIAISFIEFFRAIVSTK